MHSIIEDGPVMEKTRELCQTILDSPDMQSIRKRIDAFMEDDSSRSLYNALVTKGQALQQKQDQSEELSTEEINDFEQGREALLGNPLAREFLEAQEELHNVQHSIQKYIKKTMELGRMPTSDDLNSSCGGGGGGCGCGHGHHH